MKQPSFSRVRLGVEQTVVRFTPNEDALITELRIQGLSTPQIARFVRAAIGTTRSAVTIGQRLKALAAAEEREADAGYFNRYIAGDR